MTKVKIGWVITLLVCVGLVACKDKNPAEDPTGGGPGGW